MAPEQGCLRMYRFFSRSVSFHYCSIKVNKALKGNRYHYIDEFRLKKQDGDDDDDDDDGDNNNNNTFVILMLILFHCQCVNPSECGGTDQKSTLDIPTIASYRQHIPCLTNAVLLIHTYLPINNIGTLLIV